VYVFLTKKHKTEAGRSGKAFATSGPLPTNNRRTRRHS